MTNEVVLPGDIEACHTLLPEKDVVIAECRTAIAVKDALVAQQNPQLTEQKDKLVEMHLRLNAALQAAFRKRTERYAADPNQLKIDFGNSPEVADAAEGIADAVYENIEAYKRRKQQPLESRSEQLPAHLPRLEVILPVPEDQKFCPPPGQHADAGPRGPRPRRRRRQAGGPAGRPDDVRHPPGDPRESRQVTRVIKVLGGNCTGEFEKHPHVSNGPSELFAEIWGPENAIGVRSAVGMGSLPDDIPVEIEALFELA